MSPAQAQAALAVLPSLDCAGCRKCCEGDTITLQPGEPHKRWKTDFDAATGARTLKRGPDGNCVYLGPKGCRIHGKQPAMCRAYDCRAHVLMKLARGLPEPTGLAAFDEGKRRLGLD